MPIQSDASESPACDSMCAALSGGGGDARHFLLTACLLVAFLRRGTQRRSPSMLSSISCAHLADGRIPSSMLRIYRHVAAPVTGPTFGTSELRTLRTRLAQIAVLRFKVVASSIHGWLVCITMRHDSSGTCASTCTPRRLRLGCIVRMCPSRVFFLKPTPI